MKELKSMGWIFLFTYLLACVYIIIRWPYTSQDVMEDMAYIGPYGFILDAIVIYLLYRWYRNRNKKLD